MKLTIFVILLGCTVVFAGFSLGSGEKGTTETGAIDSDDTMSTGGKILFTTLEDAWLRAAESPTVLFFSAAWCPTCRAANKEIDARLAELGEITVIVVDYDTENELKRMYNVAYQHTFVLIDGEGKTVSLWNGGVDAILDKVKSAEKN